MGLTETTPAASEPITAAQAKEWLRVDTGDTSQDNILTILIEAARRAVEAHTNRALINTTFTWVIDGEDARATIYLPRIPAASITSITTHNEKVGADDTLISSDNYELVEASKIVQRNAGWTAGQWEAAATIVFVAGYGAAAANVPADIRQAILRIVAQQYESRGDAKSLPMIDETTEMLLEPYRYLI